MTTDDLPWAEFRGVVLTLGQSWVETRFATWLLLDLMPMLEADPSDENWYRVLPLQQYLFTAGMQFENAAQELIWSEEEWVERVADAINEMRRILIAESEWCGTRMQLLTERANQPTWPFPFRHAIR